MTHRAQQNTDCAHENSTSLIEVLLNPGHQITAILKKVTENFFFLEIKFFARKIFKPLNKMGDHIVHIILKTFLNIPISLAVRASLGINNSLILVLYACKQ